MLRASGEGLGPYLFNPTSPWSTTASKTWSSPCPAPDLLGSFLCLPLSRGGLTSEHEFALDSVVDLHCQGFASRKSHASEHAVAAEATATILLPTATLCIQGHQVQGVAGRLIIATFWKIRRTLSIGRKMRNALTRCLHF